MKFIKTWAAVAALAALTTTSAHAALENMDTVGGSAFTFLALDPTGSPASLMVDLGFMLTDFAPGSSLVGTGQNVVWNFNTNSLSVNGVAQSGTYNWSAQYAAFQGVAQAAETKFALIAGDNANFKYLTTGKNVTAAQKTLFVDNGGINDLSLVNNGLFAASGNKGTFPSAGEGALAVTTSTTQQSGYVGSSANFGTGGNWRTNLTWNALGAEGGALDLYVLDANAQDVVSQVAGAFNYSAGVLTWQTTSPVPEPSVYMVALAGLAVLTFAGRRRNGK